jgi:hypothetical protein
MLEVRGFDWWAAVLLLTVTVAGLAMWLDQWLAKRWPDL